MARKSLLFTGLVVFVVLFAYVVADDDIDDDEEFIGAPVDDHATPKESKIDDEKKAEGSKKKKAKAAPAQPFSRDPRDWLMEIAFLSFIVLFILNFFSGKKANELIATAWGAKFNSLFHDHFALVGATEGASMLMKESYCTYKMWASGRSNVDSLMCTLELKKRQDLFYTLIGKVFDSPDVLQMEFVLPENTIDNFCWALLLRKDEKSYREAFKDIAELCPAGTVSKSLPEHMCVCTDCPAISSRILEKISMAIKEYEENVISIHVSDNFPVEGSPRMARFVFKLPEPAQMERLSVLMKMSLYLVDWVSREKLTAAEKASSKKARELMESKRMKEQIALQKERLALKKQKEAEKEKERYESMSVDEKRKYEEKKRQEDYKKKLKSGMKSKMMKIG